MNGRLCHNDSTIKQQQYQQQQYHHRHHSQLASALRSTAAVTGDEITASQSINQSINRDFNSG